MIRFEPQHFQEIKEFIFDYSGILLERTPLKGAFDRIKKHMEMVGVNKARDYHELLRNPGSLNIRDELMALVTVDESYFFRNPAQFRFLAMDLLPVIFQKKRENGLRQINIWSAGCAKGEETYSIAALVDRFQGNYNDINFHIMGTDINTGSVERARNGVFRKRSVRHHYWEMVKEFPPDFLGKVDPETFEVSHKIREKVDFRFLNLRERESLNLMRRTDIIFCRNVLIYFDDAFRKSLTETFFHLLNTGGYLFLGETESLPAENPYFELIQCNGGFCYRKSAKLS